LQAHGRSGVPLYLYYAPGAAEPVVLPQVLSPGVVLSAIGS
jgi:thiol:disulfide interchange protein